MKRLNLNNTIAKMMMQRENSTMKDGYKCSFLSNLFLLILLIAPISVYAEDSSSTSDGKPYYVDGIWYSLYDTKEKKYSTITSTDESNRCPYVYPPTNQDLDFHIEGTENLHCNQVNLYEYDGSNWPKLWSSGRFNKNSLNAGFSSIINKPRCSRNITQISIKYEYQAISSGAYYKTSNFTITLAKHILFKNNTNFGTTDAQTKNFGNVNVGSESEEYVVPLRSFLTNGDLKYKITRNAQDYQISISGGAYTTPTPDNEVTIPTEDNKCGYNGANPNAAGNPINTDNFIKVKFTPKTDGQRDAALIIYDGTNSVTVNLTGTGTLASKEFGSDASRIFLGQSSQPETITASTLGGFDNNYEIVAPNHFEVKTNGSWGTTATINNGWGGTYYVRFSPKDTNGGTKSGTVTLRNRNNRNETYNILSVTGYPNKEAFDFGEVTINTKSNSRQFVLSDYWKTLTNATLTVPEFFEISADNSNYGSSINMSAISQGSPFYVRFDAKEKAGDNINDKIGVVTVSYNQESIELIDLSGKRSRKTPTITWVSDKMLIYANGIHECLSTFIDVGKSDLGDGNITFSSSDNSKIGICDENGNLISNGNGPGSYFIYRNTSGTVDITINTAPTSIYNEGTATQQFNITNLIKQEIVWNQQLALMKIKMGDTQSTMSLDAYCVEQGTSNPTGVPVQYQSSNTSVVSVQGNQLTILAPGTATLTASAERTTQYEKPADVVFDVKVKAAGDNSCDEYALDIVSKKSNTNDVYFKQVNGRYVPADKISFTYYVIGNRGELFSAGSNRNIKIKPIFSDGTIGNAFLDEKGNGGKAPFRDATANTRPFPDYQLTENTIGLKFEGDYGDNGYVSSLRVTQATYLRTNVSIDFGERTSGLKHSELFTVATYSNLTDEVTATLVKSDGTAYTDGKFEIDETDTRNNMGDGCGDFGDIKIAIKYKPMGDNVEHTCTLKIVGKTGQTTTEPIYIPIKGKAVKASQTLTWTQTFSGLDALSTQPVAGVHKAAIPLNATTDATDAAGNIETVSYKSSDPSIANVVNRKLEIYKAGTVNITAFHNGNDIYRKSDEAQGTKTITIAHAKPNFEFDPLDVPVSGDVYQTIVFETYTLNAKSEGTDGNGVSRQSNGQINYKVVAGNATVTLNNANLTFNTRGTAEGTDVWVEASLAETEVFAAETCTLKMKAQRTTPSIFEWDITPADVYYAQGKTKTFRAQKDPNNDGKIRYSVPNSDIIEIEDPYVGEYKVVKVGGPVTISAHLEEGTDYYAATTVLTQNVYVKSASPMLQFVGTVPQTIHYGDNTQQVLAESTSNPPSMGSISYEYVEVDGTDIATVTTVHNPTDQKLYGKIEPKKQGKFKIKAIIQMETSFDRYAYEEIISDEIEVLAAEQNITWSSSQQTTINTLGTGAEVKLEATSSNKNNTTLPGNPVKFRIAENGTIARIEQRTDGWYLVSNGAGSGEVTVRAFADGSEQYEANDDEVNDKVFTINKVQQTIVWNYTDGKITIPATKLNNDTLINMPTLGYVTTKTMIYRFENVSSTFRYSIAGNNQLKLTLLSTAANTDRMYASIEGDENTIGVSDIPLEIRINKITPVILWDNKPESNLTISTSAADKHILTGNAYLINTSTGKTIDNEKVSLEIENIGEICSTNGKIITNNERQDIDYNGQGSGKVKITAHFDGNEIYNPTENNPYFIVEVQKTLPTVNLCTPSNVHYGDKVRLNASVDPAGLNPDIKYTYSSEFDGLSFDNDNNVANVQEVRNGVTITARVEDCWYSESTGTCEAFDIAKSAQSIVWEQTDMNLPVVGASDVQLTAYAIDSRHNDPSTTCLELTDDGKYITAKTAGDNSVNASETDMAITYIVEEQSGVCKVVNDEPIVTVDETGLLHVTGNGTGSVKITPTTVSEGAHYTSATGTPIIVTVSKVTPTISITEPVGPLNYGTGPHTLTASSIVGSYSSANDSNAAFTYKITEGTDVASINNDQLTILKSGTVKVTATQTANCIVNSATSAEFTITINEISPSLEFTTVPTVAIAYGDNTQSVKAESKSSPVSTGTITYSSSNLNVATVDATTGAITPVSAGTFQVIATITAVANYWTGQTVNSSDITIEAANPELQFVTVPTTIDYGANSQTIKAESQSSPKSEGAVTYTSNNTDVATVDATTGVITPVSAGTFTVTANIAAVAGKWTAGQETSSQITINRADPQLEWKVEPQNATYDPANNTQSINAATNSDGAITYSVTPENSGASIDPQTCVLTITKAGTYTVEATVAATSQYQSNKISKEITISQGTPTLTINGNETMECYSTQNLTFNTDNEEKSEHHITYQSNDDNVIRVNGYEVEALSVGIATITATLDATTSWESKTATITITVTNATLRFVGSNGENGDDWFEANNWSPQRVPTSTDNASVESNCTIRANSNAATCLNLTFAGNGSLTVNADAVLDVKGTITNTEASKLKLKADENSSATVLFASGTPDATVESWIKGTTNPSGGFDNPDWQYRGFIGSNPITSNSTTNNWGNVVIYEWNERYNATNCWKNRVESSDNTAFSPWKGYCMADYRQEKEAYVFTTKLITTAEESEYHLTRTESVTGTATAPNCGVNMITNSWSAPIDMSATSGITFGENVEKTFYFFETRSHLKWEQNTESSVVTYPIYTGETANQCPNLIAAGQSFIVKVTGSASASTLTIRSDALAHQASGVMHAPAEKERFNVLSITMSVDTMADRLFLLESENCSGAFDNGYDGTKIEEGNMPQIFASNEFGHTAVNTDKTMLGQRIGYSAAEDGALCTITFNTERLDGFSELYLYDRATKRYANILAGDSYSFTGTKAGEEERFEIVGRRDDGSEFVTSSDMMIEVVGNKALLSGFAGSNDEVFITDMNGKRLWTERASNGPWFELPNLPAGVYLINCGEANCKFIVK